MVRAICILGMHRSGTSLVARLLSSLGVFLGVPEHHLPANEANPEGYWEIEALMWAQDSLLDQYSRRWDTAFPLPAGWQEDPEVEPHRERIRRIVKETFGGHDDFGWKDPRTCLLLPLWKQILQAEGISVHYVVVLRNPLDVASSLVARDGFEVADGLGLWYHYNLQILTETAGEARTAVRYEDLLDHRNSQIRRLADVLSLPPGGDQGAAEEVVNPRLCHSRSSDDAVAGRAPELVASLYELLLQALSGEIPWGRVDEGAAHLRRDLERYAAVLQHDVVAASKLAQRGRIEHRQEVERLQALHARELAAIHDSRLWRLADRYWRLRRRLGGAR